MNLVGKILPSEGYFVKLNQNPPIEYAKSLTHLYQPLVGIEAVVLYQTLLHEIELQDNQSLQSHHTLMNYLKIPLDSIYEARIQLEGIGLLKTFEKHTDEGTHYIYELLSPFSPSGFFKDAMLSELLYHHIGERKYDSLKKFYHSNDQPQSGKDVTKSFGEVFQTFKPLYDDINKPESIDHEDSTHLVNPIDFDWMETMLKQRMVPARRVLTNENQKVISEMLFLYDLATYEVEKSVLWALTDENYLDIEEFKKACHDQFSSKQNVTPINLSTRTKEKPQEEPLNRPLTKEEQLIKQLETISPKHLLEDLSSGNHASEQDMKMIRDVMTTQGLPSPVMNVLIHYVLLQSDMKLSKAYLGTIASHWSRADLKSAKQAMEFAKKEIDKAKSKQGTNEVIPEWFKDRNNKESMPEESNESIDSKEEQDELEALMKQYAEDS